MTHNDSKAKQNELGRSSLKQHSVLNPFFIYGYPTYVANAKVQRLIIVQIEAKIFKVCIVVILVLARRVE